MKPKYRSGIVCLFVVVGLFSLIGYKMGASQMLNTIMHTAHDLLLNTCFFLMGICVITGAIGKLFVEFGVVDLLEKIVRPLMRPLFHLPGVASLGAVMTFLSDNPAIITLSKDKRFSSYFKKYQFVSLTNFGTAFGMGLIVMIFMIGKGYAAEPFVGLVGAIAGAVTSTRLMQHFTLKAYPQYAQEDAAPKPTTTELEPEHKEEKTVFLRTLNSLLDGGKTGVDVGIAIIPGVLIISTLVMLLTFGQWNLYGRCLRGRRSAACHCQPVRCGARSALRIYRPSPACFSHYGSGSGWGSLGNHSQFRAARLD